MPTIGVAGAEQNRFGDAGFGKGFDDEIKGRFVVIFALGVNVQDGIATGATGACTDDISGMSAGDRFENLGVGEMPVVLGGEPAATIKRLENIGKAVKERHESGRHVVAIRRVEKFAIESRRRSL